MAMVYVSIGSNIEPDKNVRSAIHVLRDYYSPLIISTVYESEAVGFKGDNFFNLVVGFETDQDVFEVANILNRIEDEHDRDRRGPRFSARTIDLDLLLYDDKLVNERGVNIPRDEITENAFVLRPLAEIAGDVRHPVVGRTIAELWRDYDVSRQALWPVELVLD